MTGGGSFSSRRSRAAAIVKMTEGPWATTRSLWLLVPIMCIACAKDVALITFDESLAAGNPVSPLPAGGRRSQVCGADMSNPTDLAVPGTLDGTWTGAMDDYTFPAGSSSVTMVLAQQQAGAVLGRVILGDTPYPPPSSPDIGYPESIEFVFNAQRNLPYEGFTYTVFNGDFDGTLADIGIEPREAWRSWCDLQTEVYRDGSTFQCSYDLPIASEFRNARGRLWCDFDGPEESCDKFVLCVQDREFELPVSRVCDCTKDGCSVCMRDRPPIMFRLQLQGDTLSGTVVANDTDSMPFLQQTIGGKTVTLRKVSQ
jgi:hypothetical protein